MLRICYSHVTYRLSCARAAWLVLCICVPFGAINAQQTATASTPAKKAAPIASEKVKRWFEFDALSLSTRYRLIRNAGGHNIVDQLQYQLAGRWHFKFDNDGKYS